MKLSHKLHSRTATPFWLLASGLLLSIAGVTIWCRPVALGPAGETHQSLAVTAILIGVILTVYALHEVSQRRR